MNYKSFDYHETEFPSKKKARIPSTLYPFEGFQGMYMSAPLEAYYNLVTFYKDDVISAYHLPL